MARKKKVSRMVSERALCSARLKTCRNKECRYRFKKGDKSWKCVKCGEDRHCGRMANIGSEVCNVHGAKGGAPVKAGKYTIPAQIAEYYNTIIADPDLMNLSINQAIFEARVQQLLLMVHENDSRGADAAMREGMLIIESAVNKATEEHPLLPDDVMVGITLIREALKPTILEKRYWRDIKELTETIRRLNDTERKYEMTSDQTFTAIQVVEAIALFSTIASKYIPTDKDRLAFAAEMRELTPRYRDKLNAPE